MNDWDPIEVKGIPEAEDEYDSYVPKIYNLLNHHESEKSVFDYLWEIETNYIGLSGNRKATKEVAKNLVTLRNEIDKTSLATASTRTPQKA